MAECKLRRGIERWVASDPSAMLEQSPAAIYCALDDARSDILTLCREVQRLSAALATQPAASAEPLLFAINFVLKSFKESEKAGYHTRDREFAIGILQCGLEKYRSAPVAAQKADDARDAERWRWLRDLVCCSLTLSRNDDHACNYMTAEEWIRDFPEHFADDDPAEVERMMATNTIWRLQIYPNTPVGFNVWHGATPEAAIDAAIAQQRQEEA